MGKIIGQLLKSQLRHSIDPRIRKSTKKGQKKDENCIYGENIWTKTSKKRSEKDRKMHIWEKYWDRKWIKMSKKGTQKAYIGETLHTF